MRVSRRLQQPNNGINPIPVRTKIRFISRNLTTIK